MEHELHFLNVSWHQNTAILAWGFEVVCIFVNDEASTAVMQQLADLIGLEKIGFAAARIFKKLGCWMLRYDVVQQPEGKEIGLEFTGLATIYSQSDIISLHCPLTPETYYLVNENSII